MAKPTACDAAIVFAEQRAAAGLRDRLISPQQVRGAGVELLLARLMVAGHERVVVVARLDRANPPDFEPLIAALIAAHRPAFFVGAGFAKACGEAKPWTKLTADEVRRDGAPTLPLARLAGAEGVRIGGFFERPDSANVPAGDALATSPWCYRFADACHAHGCEAAVVAVAEPPLEAPGSAERRNVARQASLAGKAGAVLRLLARRPAELPAVWRQQETRWEGQERLADLVVETLRNAPASC